MGQRWDKVRGTTSSVFGIGNGRPGDKALQALIRAADPPDIKWDELEQRWKYSLDGVVYLGLGEYLLPIPTVGFNSGEFGYIAADCTLQKTDASTTTKSRCAGAYVGVGGFALAVGVVTQAKFSQASAVPIVGKAAFLARADDEGGGTAAGKLTAKPPVSGVIAKVGLVVNVDSNFLITRRASILLQVDDITRRST